SSASRELPRPLGSNLQWTKLRDNLQASALARQPEMLGRRVPDMGGGTRTHFRQVSCTDRLVAKHCQRWRPARPGRKNGKRTVRLEPAQRREARSDAIPRLLVFSETSDI